MGHVHHQRLAWDSARIIVASIEAGTWPWLAYQLGERLSPEYRDTLVDSSARLNRHPDRAPAEAGLWRETLTDLLNHRPTAGAALSELMSQARDLLVLGRI